MIDLDKADSELQPEVSKNRPAGGFQSLSTEDEPLVNSGPPAEIQPQNSPFKSESGDSDFFLKNDV